MVKTLFFLFFLFLIEPLSAQDMRTWRLSLGAGMVLKKNMRVGNTYEDMDKKFLIKPIPFIQGGYGRISIGPQGLVLTAVGNHLMNISAFINKHGDRYHGLGMLPRKDSFFSGISAKFFRYGLSFSRDINGRSKGHIAQLSYSHMFPMTEKLILRANLGVDWYDDQYAEYYYGVRSFESTSNRQEYHLSNYLQPGIGVMPIYKLTVQSSLIGAINLKYVPEDVRLSPTMNRKKVEWGGILGYSYNL